MEIEGFWDEWKSAKEIKKRKAFLNLGHLLI